MKGESPHFSWRAVKSVIAVGFALITISEISSAARTSNGPSEQDTLRLESRINQLEQRYYILESSIRNLEQKSRLGGATSGSVSQEELGRLRSEVQSLELRLAEDECGLAKLDERTLNQEIRAARRRSGAGRNDPCRVNVDEPLRLPDRRE